MHIAVVGASGYGAAYLDYILSKAELKNQLVAVVDPYAQKSRYRRWLHENNIPVFHTLGELFADRHIDLTLICSPVQFHLQHAGEALQAGSAVLCEKPLCASVSDAMRLRKLWMETNLPFGVGFQWSFSKTMKKVKTDILAGKYGKPLLFKTLVSWPRNNAYFDSNGWRGKKTDAAGNLINDSIATNAAAHYLHNILFMLGGAMDQAASPDQLQCRLYRARDIQTYDTCFLSGRFRSGAEMLYCASHVAEAVVNPRFEYIFEKGRIYFDQDHSVYVTGEVSNQEPIRYGNPETQDELFYKIDTIIEDVKMNKQPICSIDTAIPHLKTCERLAAACPVIKFPNDRIRKDDSKESLYVAGLLKTMNEFYESGRFPAP